MFSDHKKSANDYILAPTIISTSSGNMDSEAIEQLAKLTDGFKLIEIRLISLMNEYEGNSVIQSELKSAITKVTNTSNQAKDIVIAEYNTLSSLVRETKFEAKVLEGFTDIIMKSVTIATKVADFVFEATTYFIDGASNNDDSIAFVGTLATNLDIAMANAITKISDVCFDAERLANKLISGLS